MQAFKAISQSAADSSGTRYDSACLAFQQATAMAVETSLQKEIVIHTEEGDTVTLSWAQQSSATFTRYDAAGVLFDADVSSGASSGACLAIADRSQSYTFFDSREMTIGVEGTLSQAELADIQKAIGAIDRIMTPMLAGKDPEALIDKAEKLLALDNIADIQADYSFSQSAAIVQSTEMTIDTAFADQPPALDLQAPQTRDDAMSDDIGDVLSAMMEKNRIPPGRLRHPLKQLLANMRAFIRSAAGTRSGVAENGA